MNQLYESCTNLDLKNIRKLLTFVPLKEADYTYQFLGTKKQKINTGTLHNYILSVLCPNHEIVKFLTTTKEPEIQTLFHELPAAVLPGVNSITFNSSLMTDTEIVGSLEVIFRSSEKLKLLLKDRNFEFIYLPRLCNTSLPEAPEIFESVIKILHSYNEYKKKLLFFTNTKFDKYLQRIYELQESYYPDEGPEPNYTGFSEWKSNFYKKYTVFKYTINNLLDILNKIPSNIDPSKTKLEIYLTSELYYRYIDLFNTSVKRTELSGEINFIEGATIPFSWLMKHPNILFSFSGFNCHQYGKVKLNQKYIDVPEYQKISDIFGRHIKYAEKIPTFQTFTVKEEQQFNNDLLHWIIKDCPILTSNLRGDTFEITGCDISTPEQIYQELMELIKEKKDVKTEDYISYVKIGRERKVRCFRKLKKILGLKNPLAKERAIINFHLTLGAQELDVDVLNAYIFLAIRGQENTTRPRLNIVFHDDDFYTTATEPASQFFTEGGAADGPGEGGAAHGPRDITI